MSGLVKQISAKSGVVGSSTVIGNATFTSTAGAGVTVIDSDDKAAGWTLRANGTRFQIGENGVGDRFAIKAGGNTGIGTVNPTLGILQVENSSSNSNIAINAPGSGAHSELYHITANRRFNVGVHGTTSKYFIYDNNGGATRLEIDTNGNITTGATNNERIIIGSAGGGIDFSNCTGNAGANVFDFFEEGTWTPTWVVATGTITPYSLNNPRGFYRKIGDVVYIWGYISFSANTALNSSDSLRVGGLPFTSRSSGFGQSANQAGGVHMFAEVLWSNSPQGGRIPNGSNEIHLTHSRAAGGSTAITVNDMNYSANHSQAVFYGQYLA